MATRTAVVMVNWNGAAFLREAISSVQANSPAELVVIDNDSSDSSAEILASLPEAAVIRNTYNAGFGCAANRGIEATAAPFVLVSNVDVRFEAGALDLLEAHLLSHPDAAVAAPQLIHSDGSLQLSLRRFPTPLRILMYLSYLDRIIPTGYRVDAAGHTADAAVEQPMGAALLFRRSALEGVGTFDPQFFMYMEEVDLCERLHAAGWKLELVPAAKVVHHAGGSSSQAWERSQRNYLESVHRYFRKRLTPARLALFHAALPFALGLRALVQAATGRLRAAAFYAGAAFRSANLLIR